MGLSAGTRIGPYEIVAPLGKGGMGEVYRARDPRLNREVAIKSLPELFSFDPERTSRFEREAQMLAALTHPNIASIYGVEETAGARHLVLELVPGETLAARLESGPLPLTESLGIARQIAEALEAAHEKGIIHRDLKPGNVMLTPDGQVKVLDFGLAKALSQDGSAISSGSVDLSPTFTSPAMTAMGVIMGTAAYMAPEQAKGRVADKRSDIWAFGAVLFEMLSGRRAFVGDDASDTIAEVLRGEPAWDALPAGLPPVVGRLLRRCLQKDRKQRLPDISIARYEIDEYLAGRSDAPAAAPAPAKPAGIRRTLAIGGIAVAAVLATAAFFRFALWPAAATDRIMRFEVRPPVNARSFLIPIGAAVDVAIAPNALQFVYRVTQDNGTALALRRLDTLDSTVIPGTVNVESMSFSPNGSTLAFVTDGKLMTLGIGASAPVLVCSVPGQVVGTRWLDANTIMFAKGGIFKVAATGGKPESLVSPEQGSTTLYTFPERGPGGRSIFFTTNQGVQRHIAFQPLDGGAQKIVVQNASFPRFIDSGYLIYLQSGRLFAVRWNTSAHEVEGAPLALNDDVSVKLSGAAAFDVSADGTFVGVTGAALPYRSRFIWKSRKGEVVGEASPPDLEYPRYPKISRDGRHYAATVGVGSRGHLWIFDLAGTAQPTKLTTSHHNILPTWTPDGKQLLFRRISTGVLYGAPSEPEGLMMMAADGSSLAPRVIVSDLTGTSPVADVSPDGEWILYTNTTMAGGPDLMVKSLTKPGDSKAWLAETFTERSPAFSHNGKWVAYVGTQTGASEVWVRPFPGPGAPIRVSPAGGQEPVWGKDGKELFYQEQNKLMAAAVTMTGTSIQIGTPHPLFQGGFVPYQDFTPRTYDVAADGRFLMIEERSDIAQATVTVTTGWGRLLESKLSNLP
jgi:eukaryotic-like serine/threonine-protein kinase